MERWERIMASPERLPTNPPECDVNTHNPYQGCED